MKLGAAMLHVDCLDGRTLGDWHLSKTALWEVPTGLYIQIIMLVEPNNKRKGTLLVDESILLAFIFIRLRKRTPTNRCIWSRIRIRLSRCVNTGITSQEN
jgi:hypothetical protein